MHLSSRKLRDFTKEWKVFSPTDILECKVDLAEKATKYFISVPTKPLLLWHVTQKMSGSWGMLKTQKNHSPIQAWSVCFSLQVLDKVKHLGRI